MKIMEKILLSCFLVLAVGCATTDSQDKKDEVEEKESDFSKNVYVFGPFVNSISPGGQTSRSFPTSRAKGLVSKLDNIPEGNPKKMIESYETLIAAERLARASTAKVHAIVKKMATIDSDGPDLSKSEISYLELALAGINNGDYSFSEFYLHDLMESNNKEIKASAINAMGVIAFLEGKEPEGLQYWQQAIKVIDNFQASLLNIGFTYLYYGSFVQAAQYLAKVEEDWYASSGELVSFKMMGDADKADKICTELLAKLDKHKATFFNCGLFYWQVKKNNQKAKQYIGKAVKLPGGPATWNSEGEKVLESIQ